MMKKEQPLSSPVSVTSTTSRGENNDRSAELMPLQAQAHPKDDAVILSFALGHEDNSVESPSKKWPAGRTLQFALASCGLFWIVAALAAWAYLHAW